ncbi:ACP S-malonyltransferase [Proteiniclasticum sp. SCR006]|uniref:Malonyl CoA-acyl carrier protein transacylase n=1 Tax=Proteiniclasticum aestuarii TaxID=2817862 RepID=A0A939HC17_9CLOT|nr:ACP S-malonyltransferase [Proteiniclasticum aestuarii]MBO1265683.1 ACP S-malonyltransferase [Proteiniclasticum aestuarii]
MKINLMFPGQGAQFTGMGLDFYNEYEQYRALLNEASSVSGLNLLEILEDEEKLSETENTQIAIFTMSYGIAGLLRKEGIQADHALGLSLGEYGALTYGGALSVSDTTKLLRRRSDLMQLSAEERKGFLAAVSFMELAQVEEAVHGISGVSISNYNAPKQTVVGGDMEKKAEFEENIRTLGGKKITYLPVSGAFHTKLMESAATRFRDELKEFAINDPEIAVLSNFKGDFYERGDDYREILAKHIDHPVRLSDCLERLGSTEEDVHILLGPGKALQSILKQNGVKGRFYVVNTVEDFKKTVSELKGEK